MAHHQGDPCFYCGTPHDEVDPVPCNGKEKYPWGEPWMLGRQHARCGQSRLNPDFFKDPSDRMAYIRGYDLLPREST